MPAIIFRGTAVRIACLSLLLFIPSLMWAQDNRTTSETGADHFTTVFPSGGQLRMHIRSSGVRITGTDENKIQIHFSCPNTDDLGNVRVAFEKNGNRGDLDITGGPNNNFQITIELPRSSDLYVRMFAGELDINGITGNKDLQIHAGDLELSLDNPGDYAPVDLSVTTGDLEARAFGVSKGGLFRSFRTNTALHKNAAGKYSLHAQVGAGDLTVE
ncbi:MAG: hypothetical protein ACRD4A_03160 [Candidatus Acidiferrales bacterium]